MFNISRWINKWGKPIVGIKPVKNPNVWPNPDFPEVITGNIEIIHCGSASSQGGAILHGGFVNSGYTTTLYYSGGNGGAYPGLTISSTGVTGLYAKIQPGTFNYGSGSVTYTISGLPSNPGNALFTIQLGGQSCTFTRQVISIG